jgi:hypothetical protein
MVIQALIFVLGVWFFQQMSLLPSSFWLLAFIPIILALYRFTSFRQSLVYFLALILSFAWADLFGSWWLADALPL